MSNLHLLDLSQYIYGGSPIKNAKIEGDIVNDGSSYSTPTIASGGLSYVFTAIHALLGKDDVLVFCCDRNASIKKDMCITYKSNRNYDSVIEKQKDLAEIILKDCNFEVLAKEGYESDDIIHTIVQNYSEEFDHVYIYSGDGDMYYLVNDKVEVMPVTSKHKHVTRSNYEYTVYKNDTCKYNTCTMDKVLKGCKSDVIPPIKPHLANALKKIFSNEMMYPLMGKKKVFRSLIESYCPEALPQFDLVYPLDVEGLEVDFEKIPNIQHIEAWAKIVGNRLFEANPVIPNDVKELVKTFFE